MVSGKSTETTECEARTARRLFCRRREIFWSIRRKIDRDAPPQVKIFQKCHNIVEKKIQIILPHNSKTHQNFCQYIMIRQINTDVYGPPLPRRTVCRVKLPVICFVYAAIQQPAERVKKQSVQILFIKTLPAVCKFLLRPTK